MEIILFVQKITCDFFDTFFILFTLLGEELVFLAVVLCVYIVKDKRTAMNVVGVYLVSVGVNSMVKHIFKIPRPNGVRKLFGTSATSYSFPSGHSQSVALWVSALSTKYFRKKPTYLALGGVVIMLVMLSRMYLGHHFLQDVVVGALLGYTIGFFLLPVLEKLKFNSLFYLTIIPIAIVVLFLTHNEMVQRTIGGLVALVIGYNVDEYYIKCQRVTCLKDGLIRLALAIFGAALLFYLITLIPIIAVWKNFLSVFIAMGFGTIIVPLIFKRKEIA